MVKKKAFSVDVYVIYIILMHNDSKVDKFWHYIWLYMMSHIFIPGSNTNLCNKTEHKVFSMNQLNYLLKKIETK